MFTLLLKDVSTNEELPPETIELATVAQVEKWFAEKYGLLPVVGVVRDPAGKVVTKAYTFSVIDNPGPKKTDRERLTVLASEENEAVRGYRRCQQVFPMATFSDLLGPDGPVQTLTEEEQEILSAVATAEFAELDGIA